MKPFGVIRRNRVFTSFIASLAISLFYALQLSTSWFGLRSSGVRGPSDYIDQQSILNSANCFKSLGMNVYKQDVLPSGCGGFQYSIELLRLLNITQLSKLGSFALGTIFMWAVLLTFYYVFYLIKNYGKTDNFVALLSLISPGIWLLMERGNYDELVYLMVFVSAIILTTKFPEIGLLFIAISVLIKFYTLPLYVLSIFTLRRKMSKYIFALIAVPLTMYVLFLIKQVAAFPSTWYVSFGLKSISLYVELVLKEKFILDFIMPPILGSFIGIVFLVLIIQLFRRIELKPALKNDSNFTKDQSVTIYTALLVVFLSCFFAGMNFDYRLIYLAILVSISPLIFGGNRFRTLLQLTGLGALLLSTYSFGLQGIPALIIQFCGDVLLYGFIATQIFLIYFMAEPVLTSKIDKFSRNKRRS